ncbi:LamG-like jellyroll fold domain-containing protein [Streptomyces sp. DSM 116496]|uniref:LamG-like jellyroll fold domain-containing protein n=1 Tax=Streptomyces stoeckheimensis TaxID=3344656 RepID=UPI0038B26D8A
MTDGTDRPHSPQPEPAPENGGYGFPPGIPAPGGYGFPPGRPEQYDQHAQYDQHGQHGQNPQSDPYAQHDQYGRPAPDGGYGYPPGRPDQTPSGEGHGYGYPQGGGYGYPPGPPAAGTFGPPMPFPEDSAPTGPAGPPGPGQGLPARPFGEQPDWEAMADRSARERRKKRLWMVGGAVTVLLLLAGGGAFVLLKNDEPGGGGKKDVADNAPSTSPSASGSPGPGASPSKSYSPTVASDPTLLRDSVGKTNVRLGPEATVPKVGTHYELTLKGNPNSYAESTEAAVDTTKSFSLSARVRNTSAEKGSHVILSQGTGETFSFELGSDTVNNKQAWVFRVRTTQEGATPTMVTVAAEGHKTVKAWTVLTAVYDADMKKIYLYVEGKKIGEAAVPGIWQGSGPLQLGRARHQNAWAGAWTGSINYLRFYATPFTPEQAAAYRKGELDAGTRGSGTHAWITG